MNKQTRCSVYKENRPRLETRTPNRKEVRRLHENTGLGGNNGLINQTTDVTSGYPLLSGEHGHPETHTGKEKKEMSLHYLFVAWGVKGERHARPSRTHA